MLVVIEFFSCSLLNFFSLPIWENMRNSRKYTNLDFDPILILFILFFSNRTYTYILHLIWNKKRNLFWYKSQKELIYKLHIYIYKFSLVIHKSNMYIVNKSWFDLKIIFFLRWHITQYLRWTCRINWIVVLQHNKCQNW